MKNIYNYLLVPFLLFVLKGDANKHSTSTRFHAGGISSEQNQILDNWKRLREFDLKKYLGEDCLDEKLYSCGYLSRDYHEEATRARRRMFERSPRKQDNAPTITHLHLDALIEMRENYNLFLDTHDKEYGLKSIACGYVAMLISPNSHYNSVIVDRIENVCQKIGPDYSSK